MGRFQVMAILNAARAEFLGMPVDKALSFGLNRAIFYAQAKRGFVPTHGHGAGIGRASRVMAETRNYELVTALGNEQAPIDKRTGWFTMGGQDQTPEAFNRQVANRVKNFPEAWREAMKIVSSFPDEILLNQQSFYLHVYKPNRDILADRWG